MKVDGRVGFHVHVDLFVSFDFFVVSCSCGHQWPVLSQRSKGFIKLELCAPKTCPTVYVTRGKKFLKKLHLE